MGFISFQASSLLCFPYFLRYFERKGFVSVVNFEFPHSLSDIPYNEVGKYRIAIERTMWLDCLYRQGK